MDLPPSGWYPDPYGVPGLLRWWDGSAWTPHTHTDGGTNGADAAAPPPGAQQTTPQPAIPAAIQPAPAGASATTVQPAVQSTAVQPTTVQPTTVQPAGVQPTTVQAAAVESTALQATTVQPNALQPAGVAGAAGGLPALTAGGEHPGDGDHNTQILFLGEDPWAAQGGAPAGDLYGYQRAQRRRRIWLAIGLTAGTAAALAIIAVVVSALAQSPAPVAALHTKAPATPAAATTTSAPPTSATPAQPVTLTDGQSGLSYSQLPNPWQPTCPGTLNNGFTWTAGESAVAGQVNGGQTTWYGVACSGPLPQQYGYNGVADLANVDNALVNQFNGAYYGALNHSSQTQVSQPVQVSGHAGWEIKFLITYNDPQGQGLSFGDELAAVVVVDNGSAPPGVFYTSVPGNLGETNVDGLVSSLQLTAPPQPSSPPATPPDGGSPGDGGGGNGGNGP